MDGVGIQELKFSSHGGVLNHGVFPSAVDPHFYDLGVVQLITEKTESLAEGYGVLASRVPICLEDVVPGAGIVVEKSAVRPYQKLLEVVETVAEVLTQCGSEAVGVRERKLLWGESLDETLRLEKVFMTGVDEVHLEARLFRGIRVRVSASG